MAGQPGENGALSPPDSDSEHLELLQRIQSAIPDINRLLHGFRNTHSKLSTREAEIKQIGNQHEQALMHKEYYIEALQSQMKKTANQSAEDGSKLKNTINELRLELGNLQEKQKDLEDGLAVHQKSNEELTQTKAQLEGQIAQLNTDIQEAKETHEKELENQKEEHEKALVAQKQELTELFEEIKNEDEKIAAENLETRERELRSEQEAAKGEWEKERSTMQESLEAQRTELEAIKTELSSKIADLESKETELGSQLSALTSTREELAAKLAELEASRKEIEELHQKHASESDGLREGHAGELDSLRKSHDEQVAAAAKDLDDKIAALEAHFREKEQLWAEQRAILEKQLAEKNDELSSAEREKERMEGDGIIKEQHLQRAVSEMKSTIDHLDRDCDRLRKTLLSLGEATDLKSTKGDQFL
jgi:chromosome segregation ATPase